MDAHTERPLCLRPTHFECAHLDVRDDLKFQIKRKLHLLKGYTNKTYREPMLMDTVFEVGTVLL